MTRPVAPPWSRPVNGFLLFVSTSGMCCENALEKWTSCRAFWTVNGTLSHFKLFKCGNLKIWLKDKLQLVDSGALWEYWVPCYRPFSLYTSDFFHVGVELCQCCHLLSIVIIPFMDKVSGCSQGVSGLQSGGLRITSAFRRRCGPASHRHQLRNRS